MEGAHLYISLLSSQEKNLDWFPRMRAMSLVSSEGDSEQNEMRSLQDRLESTVTLVTMLSDQLTELKEQVRSHFLNESQCSLSSNPMPA